MTDLPLITEQLPHLGISSEQRDSINKTLRGEAALDVVSAARQAHQQLLAGQENAGRCTIGRALAVYDQKIAKMVNRG